MKYYIVWFTGRVTKKFQVTPPYGIDDAIQDYMREQNKGEAKSDRIAFIRKLEVTPREYELY
ncbi:hypothetical protein Q4E40_02835 [Pontibacter sp. BT731]|uniref:hypothetical protein n=1 Tax=Pontibacter coccineus TaxID=3063328 RepID=UPI0026E2620B|nr:hypothetical protein [Pontibacter sp. BT731]MDO6389049.1 hypothetical protein [Pontibacter sp. BT731]